jgi:hypothetical protein
MVTIEWKSLTGPTVPTGDAPRVVSSPIQHQGVREALRNAFTSPPELPHDIARLLAKLA